MDSKTEQLTEKQITIRAMFMALAKRFEKGNDERVVITQKDGTINIKQGGK